MAPEPEPFPVQPDPEKPFYVQPKGEKLIRHGQRDYRLVARKPNGERIEVRLVPGRYDIAGL